MSFNFHGYSIGIELISIFANNDNNRLQSQSKKTVTLNLLLYPSFRIAYVNSILLSKYKFKYVLLERFFSLPINRVAYTQYQYN